MFHYYLVKYGRYVVRIMPLRMGYILCTLLGWLVYWGNGGVRRAVQNNLRHVLAARHLTRTQARRMACRVIINQQKNYYDLMRLPYLASDDINRLVLIEGREHFEAALTRGKGIILASPHLGNYNLVTQIAVPMGIKGHIIAERLTPPKVHDLINGLRERLGLHLVPIDDPNVARRIVKILRGGEVLGLAMDRVLTENGQPVMLFGSPAMLPTGPVTLALRLGTPLLPIRAERVSDRQSVVHIYPALDLKRTGDMERDLARGMAQMAAVLEAMVRQTPDQWVVLQPVWPEDGGPALPAPAPPTVLPAPADEVPAQLSA